MYGPQHIDRTNRRISAVSSGNCRQISGRDRNSNDFALSSLQYQSSPPEFSFSAIAKNRLPSATSIDRYKCRIRNLAAGIASVGIIGLYFVLVVGPTQPSSARMANGF